MCRARGQSAVEEALRNGKLDVQTATLFLDLSGKTGVVASLCGTRVVHVWYMCGTCVVHVCSGVFG